MLGRDTADVDFVTTRSATLLGYVGQKLDVLIEGGDTQLLHDFPVDGLHSDRNVLHAFGPFSRGNDDFFKFGCLDSDRCLSQYHPCNRTAELRFSDHYDLP